MIHGNARIVIRRTLDYRGDFAYMPHVRKAVIPVAGLGTRFLPVTKSVPKELLPIVTTPTLHIVIEEAVASGIEEIIFVTSPLKVEIERYFQNNTPYDVKLADLQKEFLLDGLRSLINCIEIKAAFQDSPKGLGHAILCAKEAVRDEPFVIVLPDVLIESNVPCCKQLIEAYEKSGCAVNATEHSPRRKLHLYGIYDIASSEGRFHKARGVVEKPSAEDAPSDLSVVGRYLFPPDVMDILENTLPGKGGEIQLADAMNTLASKGRMMAYEYEGRQFDTGDPVGFLKANIFYGRKLYSEELDQFMMELLKETVPNNVINE